MLWWVIPGALAGMPMPFIHPERWLNMGAPLIAYEDELPLSWTRISTGRPGWETPLGTFSILRRVAKETMDSATLLGRDADRADRV